MSVIFKLDGTVEYGDDVKDEQQDLKDRLQNFEENIQSHWNDLRGTRNSLLASTDWTQGADSPFASDKKTEWQNYRSKLRDLPTHANAPIWFQESDIPLSPVESSVPDWANGFIKSRIDPIGIGTTSWVGVGTDGIYFEQTRPCNQITYDLFSKAGGISTDTAVIGTNNDFDFVVNITDMIAESEYHYSIESNPKTNFINRSGFIDIIPDSNNVGIVTIPVSISGVAGTVTSPTTVSFTLDVSDTEKRQEVCVVGIATTSVGVGTT
jgi:hypothetical protein